MSYTPSVLTKGTTTLDQLNAELQAISIELTTLLRRDTVTDNEMQQELRMNGFPIINIGQSDAVNSAITRGQAERMIADAIADL